LCYPIKINSRPDRSGRETLRLAASWGLITKKRALFCWFSHCRRSRLPGASGCHCRRGGGELPAFGASLLPSPCWRELLAAVSAGSASSAVASLCAVSAIAGLVHEPEVAAVGVVAELGVFDSPDGLVADGAVKEDLRAGLAGFEDGS
jgi:hypothetical protein